MHCPKCRNTQRGGGALHTLSGLAKGFALYYGIALVTMAGLTSTLRRPAAG
jgi:hypothetical protein